MLFCILNLKAVLFPHREYDRCKRSREVLSRTASVAWIERSGIQDETVHSCLPLRFRQATLG